VATAAGIIARSKGDDEAAATKLEEAADKSKGIGDDAEAADATREAKRHREKQAAERKEKEASELRRRKTTAAAAAAAAAEEEEEEKAEGKGGVKEKKEKKAKAALSGKDKKAHEATKKRIADHKVYPLLIPLFTTVISLHLPAPYIFLTSHRRPQGQEGGRGQRHAGHAPLLRAHPGR
jgi:hypothetical protein